MGVLAPPRLTLCAAPHRKYFGAPVFAGGQGVPKFISPQILLLCDSIPHAKFQNQTIAPSGRKVSEALREKNAVKSGHLVPLQGTQVAQTNIHIYENAKLLPPHSGNIQCLKLKQSHLRAVRIWHVYNGIYYMY
jgi:hypothetical protein